MTAKALSPMDQQGADVVRRKARGIVRQLRAMVEQGIVDAADIDDEGPVPAHWTPRRARVARDMREPKRYMRSYIAIGADRLNSLEKLEAAKATGNLNLNVAVVNVVRPVAYEEIEVEVKE